MKLDEIWDEICIRVKYKKPEAITFLMWAGVYVVGGIIIVFLETKEFFGRRVKNIRALFDSWKDHGYL